MSHRYEDITQAGGRVAGITVDPPEQNSAMIEKLGLRFPILSDPDRSKAIEPYGVADEQDPRNISRPAIFVVSPDAEIAFSQVAGDFADRSADDAALSALRDLDLQPTTPESFELGPIEPGAKAMPVHALIPYYRGAKFAVTAMKKRNADLGGNPDSYIEQMDRYIEAVRGLRDND